MEQLYIGDLEYQLIVPRKIQHHQLNQHQKNIIPRACVIFVDEVSMMNNKLLDFFDRSLDNKDPWKTNLLFCYMIFDSFCLLYEEDLEVI